jgi:hypothetical protein
MIRPRRSKGDWRLTGIHFSARENVFAVYGMAELVSHSRARSRVPTTTSGASFPSIFEEDFEGDTFDVNRPRNGDNGTVVGLEMAAQAPLTFLPGVLGGLTCTRITR